MFYLREGYFQRALPIAISVQGSKVFDNLCLTFVSGGKRMVDDEKGYGGKVG